MAKENENKNEAQLELDAFRTTGIAYLSDDDKDMDFSNVDDPKNAPNENA